MDHSTSESTKEKRRVIIEVKDRSMSHIPLVMELKKRIG